MNNISPIKQVRKQDLDDILNLQKRAFMEVAKLMDNYNLTPLLQTIEELQKEYEQYIILKYLSNDNKIIGSVRGFLDKENKCQIRKLVVDPDFQNKKVGRALMYEIEKYFPTCEKFVLFTGEETPNTMYLYTKIGYHIIGRQEIGGVHMFLLEKERIEK